MSEEVVDGVTEELLERLLLAPRFVAEWCRRTTDASKESAEDTEKRGCCSASPSSAVDELATAIQIATRTFESSVDLAVCHWDAGEKNRDASTVLATRVQVERAMGSCRTAPAGADAAARRLTQLARLFARRTATPFHIANCCFVGSALCEMSYVYCEWLVESGRGGDAEARLRKALHTFNTTVVDTLNQLVVKAKQSRILAERRLNEQTPHSKPRPFLTPQSKRRGLPIQPGRSPGYLMSEELRKKRDGIARTSTVVAGSTAKATGRSASKDKVRGVRDELSGMRDKWRVLLENEQVTGENGEEGTRDEAALSLARQITREIVSEMRRAEKQ